MLQANRNKLRSRRNIWIINLFRTYLSSVRRLRLTIRWPAASFVFMVRSYAILLLLLNYLVVVGTGMTGRPAPRIERPFAYVHSKDCQRLNALRVGCFDDCNGVQYKVQKNDTHSPWQKLLVSLKGLDTHCLPEVKRLITSVPSRLYAEPRLAAPVAAVLLGFGNQIYSPPRRG
jgi:hypothetical protein